MRSFVFLLAVLTVIGICCVNCGIKLVWHPKFRPPETFETDDTKNTWKSSIDMIAINPLVVRLVNETGEIIDYTGYAYAQSISRAHADNVANGNVSEDNWSGQFCNQDNAKKWDHFRWSFLLPYSLSRYCYGKDKDFTLTQWYMIRGEYYLRNYIWKDADFGDDKRFIRFIVPYEGKNYTLDTPDFEIFNGSYVPAGIEFETPPPKTVVANTPFSVTLRTVNELKETITDGIYSSMEVVACVSGVHKTFSIVGGYRLAETKVLLGGEEAVVTPYDDTVIYKNFENGLVTVTMQLEDVMDNVYINFTLKKNHYTNRRFPDYEVHPDYSMKLSYYYFEATNYGISNNGTHVTYNLDPAPDFFKAVKLTSINVTAQTPGQIRLVPGIIVKTKQASNILIENLIQVELLDVNGNRVTSGPDSNLTVQVIASVGSTCISSDSTFVLKRGIGTFMGSVCEPIASTSLAFKVATTSVGELTTTYTTSFSVGKNWNFIMHGTTFETQMIKTAFESGDRHYWLNQRTINVHNLDNYQSANNFYKLSENDMDKKVIAMLGSYNDEGHSDFVDVAHAHSSPIVTANTRTKYSNKQRYPLLERVAFSDQYRFGLICNALKTRNWNKIAVIRTDSEQIVDDLTMYSDLFEIALNRINFPKVPSQTTILSKNALDAFFEELAETKTKIIFSFVGGYGLSYLLTESAKRGLTPANGYTWIGEDTMIKDFPYNNDYFCASLNGTKCTIAFRGTIMFQSYYPTYGLDGAAWGKMTVSWSRLHGNQIVKPDDEDVAMKAFLMHDLAARFIKLFHNMLTDKLTIYGKTISEGLKTSPSYFNLIDDMKAHPIDNNRDRSNYTACMLQIDADGDAIGKQNILKKKRFLHLGDLVTPYNITKDNVPREIPFAGETFIYATVPDEEKNLISFNTINGNLLDDLSVDTLPMIETTESIKTPPAFYCVGGCGGKLLSPSNRQFWENGFCESQGVCRCKVDPLTGNPGYSGVNCQTPVCNGCIHGNCTSPSQCVCHEGYANKNQSDCSLPTCDVHGCHSDHGNCTSGNNCECKPGYYHLDCSAKCNCGKNGRCSDGNTGTGMCMCDSGYTGSTCGTHVAVIAVPTVIGIILICGLIFLIGWKKYKQLQVMAQLMSTDWKVDWDNIKMRQARQKSSMKSLVSMVSMMSAKSGKVEEKIVCQNQGVWNGKDVVVKVIRKDDIELTEDIRWEIKQMRDLKHPNLCLFVGACIESPHVCILNEVCGKGSLEDILSNDSIELGWDFRYSMLKDIVRGMQYLQKSEIGSHGRLKSSNCLVDNRWTVKLADYGMKSFKGNQYGVRVFSPNTGVGIEIPKPEEMDGCDYYNLLWTAPEIIATGVSHPNHVMYGTITGDIYSFAIMIVEMCTRHHPFHELDSLGPDQIVQMVGRLISYDKHLTLVECKDIENIGIKVLRPQVNDDELPEDKSQADGLRLLMQDCWNQDLQCRPTFDTCMKRLNKLCPHRGELMDNLIILMEHYTMSLESIVAERTSDVKEEKEKGDILLSKMLPPLIAEELKSGSNPKPEYFNCVTIYFSDVVGFGKMCAAATPYQVVELLNGLYNVMDDVIDSFDCYKVETIGDCYVVASGLPVRNGDNHAGEIASMALQLLSSFYGVGYKHLPDSQVQLRVGMHSGPIVAGVVGLKMPRYCLFGDTMNTASRMESGGFALKIHLSEDTYNILESLGGYQFISRGERQVKGRGTMTTYWLTGKDGADLRLPTEDMALSASQHDFK